MNFFDKYRVKNKNLPVMLLLAGLMTGCTGEDINRNDNVSSKVYVSASMSEVLATRDYQESGDVTSGTYYLSYPQESTLIYALGTVDFGRSVTPGIGFVLLPGNEEMTWEKVGGSMPTFYLDNVAETDGDGTSDDPMIVNFGGDSRFMAGLYNNEEENKDLLWSSIQVNTNTRTLNFQLHHNMARLNVEITVDKTYEISEDLDLTGATIEISSINQNPLSYDRATGLLELSQDQEAYSPLQLVNDDIDWASVVESDDDTNITVYTTQDFVLPPQDLLTDENRPRLTITLSNGRVFSGIIPYAMNVVDADHPEEYPMTLSFLKEHILTLRTLVSNEPPQLSFMPVKVVEWVDKGTFDLDAHQAGIYIAREFYDMIGYYNDNNAYQLQRYGNLKSDTWNFNIWGPLTLEYNSIYGQMVPDGDEKKAFTFLYHNYTVSVESGDETKNVTNAQLIQILSGELTFENIR